MSKRVIFQSDAATAIFFNEDGQLVIEQPEEVCSSCGEIETQFMAFSPERARAVALQILAMLPPPQEGKKPGGGHA